MRTPIQTSHRSDMPALLRKALSSRFAQRLSYPHGVDRYLEQFNPIWSLNQVRAEVVRIRSQTSDTVTLSLRPNQNWAGFTPGQYLRLTLSIDGKRHSRCFSPAQSLHAKDGLIELTAKLHAKAQVTRHMRDQLRIGDVVELSQAEGEFALPSERPQNILLISGGSGITPVMSMLRTLVDENHSGPISFLHYANRKQDQLYAEELQAIADSYPNIRILRCYADSDGGELRGLYSASQLRQAVPDFSQATTFLCGPPGLMQAIETTYQELGLSGQLHQERFSAAAPVPPSENVDGDVHFTRSERYVANDGTSLLDQAEAAGLSPQHGCRMGVCYACTCRKTAGQVRDLRSGQLSDAGEADIQICVSVPVGSVTLDI